MISQNFTSPTRSSIATFHFNPLKAFGNIKCPLFFNMTLNGNIQKDGEIQNGNFCDKNFNLIKTCFCSGEGGCKILVVLSKSKIKTFPNHTFLFL